MNKYQIEISRTENSRRPGINFEDLPFGRTFSDHMFVCDYKDGKWLTPKIVPFEKFLMHPASMVLHYGQAIFEGMKATKSHDGKPLFFRPEMHSKRINASARRMCMPEFPEDLFQQAIHALVDLDQEWIPPTKGSALYMRPFMFATDEFIGVKPSSTYRFIIFTGPVGPYYSKPVSLLAETEYIRAAMGGTGEAKAAGNYAGSLLPAKLANEAGYDQVMWLDAKQFKYIQEVGTMNIFFVIDGKVVTPATGGTILKGITRDSILQILRSEGYECEERPITIDEIVEAYDAGKLEECFGAGTAAVVAHVSKIKYKEKLMELPPLSERKVGQLAKDMIDGLRWGTIDDKFEWIVPVEETELVVSD